MNAISKNERSFPACGPALSQGAECGNAVKPRLVQGFARRFYGVSLGLALPMAVFTCNGFLGLLVHAIALSGAASLLEQSARRCVRTCPVSPKETADAQR